MGMNDKNRKCRKCSKDYVDTSDLLTKLMFCPDCRDSGNPWDYLTPMTEEDDKTINELFGIKSGITVLLLHAKRQRGNNA
jgi:hypothetical protein